jgi:two-component system phosphate regulon sensor histidine kinase PhoR
VDNAIKYSPGGGDIEVDLVESRSGGVQLSVRDHGIGIPAEQRGRIFDRFYQVDNGGRAGGMGLGLYISRHIVELHGGRIDVEAPQGGGTRFVVSLPPEGVGAP